MTQFEQIDLPHSQEAEQAVIGALLVDSGKLDQVAELIGPLDFYELNHGRMFDTMLRMANQSIAIDPVTVSEHLDGAELMSLVELATSSPGSSNIEHYAGIVAERAQLRKLIQTANEVSHAANNPQGQSAEAIQQFAEKKLSELADGQAKNGGLEAAKDLLKGTLQTIDERFHSKSDITGLSSGLRELDKKTLGWQGGELIVLAARPSMGKTALALNFVESALFTAQGPALVFSMEMPSESLMLRLISSVGKIDQGRVRSGKLQEDDWPKLGAAVQRIKNANLFIDDTPGLTPQDVRARVRRIAREHGNPSLVMIDYLQLMQVAGKSEGRTQEISEISRALKALAKEFNCPVIALSQLNRGVEQRPNKRPMNSDLRESGAIEQDADVILFIYRDEYYNENSEQKGIAELIIGKQRNGEIGTVFSSFQGQYSKFDNLGSEFTWN